MGSRAKGFPVPKPKPKGTAQAAQNRTRQAVAHVVAPGEGVTRFEVDGTPVAVETPPRAGSVEFATQLEESNGRKVKVMGAIHFNNPRNPACEGSSWRPCNGVHGAKGLSLIHI